MAASTLRQHHDAMGKRRAVLGIDAAWTSGQPSGVALVSETDRGWCCDAVAPSYSSFIALAMQGTPVDWNGAIDAGPPEPQALKQAAAALLASRDDVSLTITVDMPVSKTPITSRREADNAVSRRFGAAGCGTHSPSPARPGRIGAALTKGFATIGHRVAAVGDSVEGALLEVYPHPALLVLLGCDRRVPYKVSRSRQYWPEASPTERIALLLGELRNIHVALASRIENLRVPLPRSVPTLSALKRYEDALDALISAWVGMECLDERGEALGDSTAAIWCPRVTR
jgi:predicted RNase H-like nuclease